MTTASFCCKPLDLDDVAAGGEVHSYTVEATVELTPLQYRLFAQDLLNYPVYDYFNVYRGGRDGKGGVKVVRVTCRGKRTLLCNSDGFTYPRYIAFER